MPQILQFQLLGCEDLLLFFVFCEGELNVFAVLDGWLEASPHGNYVGHDCFIDQMLNKDINHLLCWDVSVQIFFFNLPRANMCPKTKAHWSAQEVISTLRYKSRGTSSSSPFVSFPHGIYSTALCVGCVCVHNTFFFVPFTAPCLFFGRGTLSQLPTPTGHLLHRMLAGSPSTRQIEQMMGSDSAFNVCICWCAKNGLKVMGSEEASNSADRNCG